MAIIPAVSAPSFIAKSSSVVIYPVNVTVAPDGLMELTTVDVGFGGGIVVEVGIGIVVGVVVVAGAVVVAGTVVVACVVAVVGGFVVVRISALQPASAGMITAVATTDTTKYTQVDFILLNIRVLLTLYRGYCKGYPQIPTVAHFRRRLQPIPTKLTEHRRSEQPVHVHLCEIRLRVGEVV